MTKCICACHENKLNKPYEHDFFCCEDMIGFILMKEKQEFLKGFPELKIVELVRKNHKSENCPHKGNCLNETEMFSHLNNLLKDIIKQSNKEFLERIKKEVENIKNKVSARQGTNKYDSCYDDVLEILKKS